MSAELDSEGRVYFNATSDSELSKGLAAVLVAGLSGRTPEEVIQVGGWALALAASFNTTKYVFLAQLAHMCLSSCRPSSLPYFLPERNGPRLRVLGIARSPRLSCQADCLLLVV